jgi:leucyl/phenylalanyl-tRNA--protein transferase
VQLCGLFAGESMFYRVSNASKVAFAALVPQLAVIGTTLFDCQVINLHTYQLGAVQVHRRDYLQLVQRALMVKTLHTGQKWPPQGPAAAAGVRTRWEFPLRVAEPFGNSGDS